MDVKKNGEGQKILRIDLFQAVAIFAGAVITTAVVTAFGLVNYNFNYLWNNNFC